MDTSAPRLSVVICCFADERLTGLIEAIDAAVAQLVPGDEVIVVVDHNPALHSELVNRYDATIKVIENAATQGLSGARNTGCALADGDVIVFLDDDARLRPGSLGATRSAFADPGVVCIGGRVVADWQSGRPGWFPDEFGWVVGCDYRGLPADGGSIRNPIGAAMAVRRTELAAAGGFSNRLGRVGAVPAGCEETLMGIELHRQNPGARIIRHEGLAVDHAVTAQRATVRYFVSRCMHEGRSKAVLSTMVGSQRGLAAERSFVLRTLSTGLWNQFRAVLRGDVQGASRALMMVVGLVVTAVATVTTSLLTRIGGSVPVPGGQDQPSELALAPDELVTVVIPTVGRESLKRTVQALLDQDHEQTEIVVVNNRPGRADVATLLAGFSDHRIRIVDEPVSGVSAARNRGTAVAAGRVVAFTDDDALPDPGWVGAILETFRADRTGRVGAVTGRVLSTAAPTQLQSWFEEAGVFDKGPDPTVWSMNHDPALDVLGDFGPHNVFFPYTAGECGSGNNMAFRPDALELIDGFDLRLGTGTPARGGEDLDAFRSLLLRGGVIAYNPKAVVYHYHRDNIPDLRDQSYGYGTGMAASLTKLAFSRRGPAILIRLPVGLYRLLAPNSAKNKDVPSEWPLQLRLIEVWGYLAGPVLFARSHFHHRSVGTRR
ncbi:glycosyltransferase family 2 protein [Williamsia sp.]|uniref:glycosyltransferase family 2 protein n=1 Tax=Williamsia sp. TaxID=1872085 RepID=UPI002F920FBE